MGDIELTSASSNSNSNSNSNSSSKKQPDYVFVFPYVSQNKENENENQQSSGCCSEFFGKRADKKAKRAQIARAKMLAKLKKAGFETHQHLSRDGDEVLVSITAKEEMILKHASVMGVRTKLKGDGGYLPYNKDRHELYEPSTEGSSFFTSGIQSYIVLNLIETPSKRGGAGISVGKARNSGKISGAFAMHDDEARKKLLRTWAKQFYKPQPLDAIRSYFGEKIALYFAWLGYYTKWLVYASFVGLIPFFNGPGHDGKSDKWDNTLTPLYCFFLALWSTFFLEFWKRDQATLASKWGVLDFEKTELSRPAFRGEEKHGVYIDDVWIDLEADFQAGKKVPSNIYYPTPRRIAKISIGTPAIFTAIGVVIAATIGLLVTRMALQGTNAGVFWGGTIGGILNGIVIAILNEIYATIATALTDWENHRTETEYEDNLIAKTFLFQFVNSYISLFYIAFFKESMGIHIGNVDSQSPETDLVDTCAQGCMTELSAQLLSILITRTVIGQIQEVLLPVILSRSKVYFETRALKKTLNNDNLPNEAPKQVKPLTKIEKQAKMTLYPSTFADYNEMIIQFGYVTLFAAAMPLASVIALVNNIIEIRTDALKLLLETQRPEYKAAEDIGTWYQILEVMSIMAVVTNILVLIVTSNELDSWYSDGTPGPNGTTYFDYHTKYKALWAGLYIEHTILFIKFIIATLIPDVPGTVAKEIANQTYRASLIVEDSHLVVEVGDDDADDKKSDDEFVLPPDLDVFEAAEENIELDINS